MEGNYWNTPHGQQQLSADFSTRQILPSAHVAFRQADIVSLDTVNRINRGAGAHPRTAPPIRKGVTPGGPPILPLLFFMCILFLIVCALANKG